MNELITRQFDYRAKIAVCGDAMIDDYYEVNAYRVSPEFPIPVLHSEGESLFKRVLGGASNVCQQFTNFNFDVSLFALINSVMETELLAKGINAESCIKNKGLIPVKKRYYSEGFPLCRLDVERKNYGIQEEELDSLRKALFSKLKENNNHSVIIFSDYNKGLFSCNNILDGIHEDIITIVDPKAGPIEKWRGCTIIKPNAKEAKDMSGLGDWKDQCAFFMSKTSCQACVITQGGEGVVGNVMGQFFEYRPDYIISPRSVIGAGDAFIAFLAMCMSHSIDIRHAVKIAFDACSIYVQKKYNSPIHPVQLTKSKHVDPRLLQNRNFSLAFTNGCFDILHSGHIELLKFAKSQADKLVVAINSDQSVALQNKSHPLINNLQDRIKLISAIEFVDFVVDFNEENPIEILKKTRPDVLVKGSDWPSPIGADLVSKVALFDLLSDYSTTKIIEKIRSYE